MSKTACTIIYLPSFVIIQKIYVMVIIRVMDPGFCVGVKTIYGGKNIEKQPKICNELIFICNKGG